MAEVDYDVAVVGASIAGCTAASLLGRAGLRVALLDTHRDVDAFKALCTHHVMASGTGTIRRLGLAGAIERAGGVRNGIDARTPWGWVRPTLPAEHGYSIQRRKLDPMLRRLAADTPGVELQLGNKVVGLLERDGAVVGVRARGADGAERDVRAGLVIGADGAGSSVARLAGAEEKIARNARFMVFAEYTGVELASSGRTQVWMHDSAVSYAMPNDDGVTVLATMRVTAELPTFQQDREGALLAAMAALPDGPAIDRIERVTKVMSAKQLPLITRDPTPCPGVALVGDAALTSDPSQGVGCGWALQSAEWLADAITEPAREPLPVGPRHRSNGDGPMRTALARYRRRRKPLLGHQATIAKEALAGQPTALDRLLVTAAVHDPVSARHLDALFNRTIPVSRFVAPSAIARALWVTARTRSLTP